jgi:iron(III) transport system substrate-binding protein
MARISSVLAAIVAVSLIVAASACGGGGGTLTIYSGRSQSLVHPLLEQFSKDTGIEIRVRYGDSAELAATILEEGNNSPADVFFSQDAGALGALQDASKLRPLPDDLLAKVSDQFRSEQGTWVGVSGRSRVVAFNPDRVNESDLPASVLGLSSPEWRGRVGWAPLNASFQAFVTGLRVSRGDESTRQWLLDMKANGAKDYPNNISIVQAVAAGEIDVGLVNHYYLYQMLSEQGQNFKARNHHFKGGDIGALINVAGVGILATSDNDDARRFIEYLLSETAQLYFANKTYEYPLVLGVRPSHDLPPLETLQPPGLDLSQLHDLQGTLKLLRETRVLP